MTRRRAAASRPRAARLVPSLLLLTSIAAAPAAADSPPLAADLHYAECLATSRQNPAAGLAAAQDWRNAGGGFPAMHCAAVALFGLARYPEAAAAFEALAGAMMQERPDLRAGALEQGGQAWLLAGKPEAARHDFDAALQYTPIDPDLLIDRARALADERQFAAAIADLDAALKLAPKRADALVYRASSRRQLGDLARARQDVDAALKLAPDDSGGLLERGNIRRLAGDAAGAREDWRAVERLAPKTPAALSAKDNLAALGAPK